MGKGTLSPEEQQKLLNKQYRQERNRLNKYKRRAYQKGYNVTEFYTLPKIPKQITKADIEELSKITKEDIYNEMKVFNPFEYGLVTPFSEIVKLENRLNENISIDEREEIRRTLRGYKDIYQERGYVYAKDLYEYHPETEANGIADISIIQNIRGRLASLPMVALVQPSATSRGDKWYYFDTEGLNEGIVGLFDEVWLSYGEDDTPFAQHLMEVEQQITEAIDKMTGKYKTEDEVESSYITISELLKQNLSIEDRERISAMQLLGE